MAGIETWTDSTIQQEEGIAWLFTRKRREKATAKYSSLKTVAEENRAISPCMLTELLTNMVSSKN